MKIEARSPDAVKAAINYIDGKRTNNGVVYYDDSMQKYYLCEDEGGLYDLAELMLSDDEDVARDAYSHWCAGTSHPECDEDGELI